MKRFRRGRWANIILRASLFITLVLVVIGGGVVIVARSRERAAQAVRSDAAGIQESERINREAEREVVRKKLGDRRRYLAEIRLAQEDFEAGHLDRARQRLQDLVSVRAGDTEFREVDFEWNYLRNVTGEGRGRPSTDASDDSGQRLEHGSPVTHLAFSPDSRHVATAGEDGVARIWDVESGCFLRGLLGHWARIEEIVFDANGHVGTASADRTARLWDAGTGQLLFGLQGRQGAVNSIAFSPEDHYLATASRDGSARLWDVRTGRELFLLRGHTGGVNHVAFAADGQLVTAGNDGTGCLWDPDAGRELFVLRGHVGPVRHVVFSRNGRRLVTAGADHAARLWDTRTGRELFVFRGHSGEITQVAFNHDGHRFATASRDHTARVWDPDRGREVFALRGHSGSVNSIAYSIDGHRLVTAGDDGAVRIWDMSSGREVLALRSDSGPIRVARFSPDGYRLATVSADRGVRIWDASPPSPEAQTRYQAVRLVRSLLDRASSEAGLRDRIAKDKAASEAVRAEAGKLAAPFWSSRMRWKAEAVVRARFERSPLRTDAIRGLAADSAVDPQVRPLALEIARGWPENPRTLHRMSRSMIWNSGADVSQYRDALRFAEAACQIETPTGPDYPAYLGTVAMAQYRLGRAGEARATLAQLQAAIGSLAPARAGECRVLVREVEALIRERPELPREVFAK